MIALRLLTLAVGFSVFCYAQDAPSVQIKVVKDIPFSAQAITESTQVLADGSYITHKTTAAIERDSEGRTRREQTLPGGVSIAFIEDPIAGIGYAVDSNKKSVRRFSISNADSKAAESVANDGESLGSQIMEGVQVEGTRLTRTVAAGDAGNERALQISIEAWYSSELQTVIMSKTTDPRVGETVYKLTNIQRGEPDRSLFEIPADYAVRDAVANR